MFLPFIPIIIALAGITIIGSLPPVSEVAPAGVWVVINYLSLLLPGLAIALISRRWLGGYSAMGFSRRRIALLVLWLALLGTFDLVTSLQTFVGGFTERVELTLLVLLLNFWLAEALALTPLDPKERPAGEGIFKIFRRNLAIPLPLIVLVILSFGITVLMESLLFAGDGLPLPNWGEMLVLLGFYVVLAGLLIPWLIPVCWRLKPLDDPATEAIILEELRANGVRVARVLSWPEEMLGQVTAGVIGMLPRFRYLLFSRGLAHNLSPEEIRSVTAHEAGHLRHHHLWYYMATMAGFLVLSNLLLRGVMLAGLWSGLEIPQWLLLVSEVALLLLFLRFGLGFLSRYFERQADGNALARLGLAPFQGAIQKIGTLNGIPFHSENWHHHGIGQRLDYLAQADTKPEMLETHNRKVKWLKRGVLGLLVLALVGQTVFSESNIVGYVVEKHWLTRLEGVVTANPVQTGTAQVMAQRAYSRGDHESAERFFRLLVNWHPEDATAQNNLAWVLVTAPPHSQERLIEGISLAEQAAGANQSAFIWDTLAEAYLRAGRTSEALQAAKQALALAETGQNLGDVPIQYYQDRIHKISGE